MDNDFNRLIEALVNIRDYRKVMGLGTTRQAIMREEKEAFFQEQLNKVADLLPVSV